MTDECGLPAASATYSNALQSYFLVPLVWLFNAGP